MPRSRSPRHKTSELTTPEPSTLPTADARSTRTSRLKRSSKSKVSKTPKLSKKSKLQQAPTPLIQPEPSQDLPAPVRVATTPEFIAVLDAKAPHITLADNLIVTSNLLIAHDVTIDFGGFSLIAEESFASARVLDIRSGNVHLTGSGKIFAMGPYSVAIRVFGAASPSRSRYTALTIDPGLHLFAPDSYGIIVSPNLGYAYGLTVDCAGHIVAHDGIYIADGIGHHRQNPPRLTLRLGATIVTDEQTGIAVNTEGHDDWQFDLAALTNPSTDSLTHPAATPQIGLDPAALVDPSTDSAILDTTPIVDTPAIISGRLDALPELTDAETDEEEIVSALTADRPAKSRRQRQPAKSPATENPDHSASLLPTAPLPPLLTAPDPSLATPTITSPAPAIAMPLTPPATAVPAPSTPDQTTPDECAAARAALSDAITEMLRLRRDDYRAGFDELTSVIREAEDILDDPESTLIDICDAAGDLLEAFDHLEERDEFSLSDAELDALFYHGAVLEEMATSSTATPPAPQPTIDTPATPAPAVDPDFSVLSDLLTTIAGLNLQNYSATSRDDLLSALDRAHSVLADPAAPQSAIDEVTTTLLAAFSRLAPEHTPRSVSAPVRLSSPAPVISRLALPTMIDELSPATTWSQGVTMIDELTPFVTDAATRAEMLRAMRPTLATAADTLARPFRKLARSLAAGLQAYRTTLHSS